MKNFEVLSTQGNYHRLTITPNRVTYKPKADASIEDIEQFKTFAQIVGELYQSTINCSFRGKIERNSAGALTVYLSDVQRKKSFRYTEKK